MNEFRTSWQLPRSGRQCRLGDTFFTVGSCFSDAMGTKLNENKFPVLVNPFGTSYNPESIHNVLRYAIANEVPPAHTYLEQNGIFANYDFHSSFAALTQSEVEKKITETIGTCHYFLKKTQWLILTYGTAWVYNRTDTGETVANCHKMPSGDFSKELLTQKKILESFEEFFTALKNFNPDIQVILTVSPVRHLKDTIPLNSVSKAVLRLTCHTLSEQHPNATYFPSYEIMMDDLRDYRFYKTDRIHPTREAETYIWNKFQEAFFTEETIRFTRQWEVILRNLRHKPFLPDSPAHQQFLKDLKKQLVALEQVIDVREELKQVESQIKA